MQSHGVQKGWREWFVRAIASNLLAMASNLLAMISNLVANARGPVVRFLLELLHTTILLGAHCLYNGDGLQPNTVHKAANLYVNAVSTIKDQS